MNLTAAPLSLELRPAVADGFVVYVDGTLAGELRHRPDGYVGQLTATAAYLPAHADPFAAGVELARAEHRRRMDAYRRNLRERADDLTELLEQADRTDWQLGSPYADDVEDWTAELADVRAELARVEELAI